MAGTFDAAIVGGGAAGLSAALTLGRACRSVLVCDDGRPRNRVATKMHGFLTRDGTPPAEMLALARRELAAYSSVQLHDAHVARAQRDGDRFAIETDGGETFSARKVLLAIGVYDALPPIDGIADLWGRGVYVCPYCDGWEVRGQRLGVFGKARRALELAQELSQWSRDLVVCIDGDDEIPPKLLGWSQGSGVPVRRERLVNVREESGYVRLELESGEPELVRALFLHAPLRQRYPLVEMLGCTIDEDGSVEIDERGRTRARGVYAAGDCVTAVHQVVLAAASGVCAAMALNEDLLCDELGG